MQTLGEMSRRRSLSGQSVLKQTVKRRQRFDMAVLLNLDNPRANRFGPRVRVIGRSNFGLDLGSFRFTLLDEFDWLRVHLFASGESRPGNVGWIDGKLAQAVIIARPAARGRGDSRKRNPSCHLGHRHNR